MRLFYFLITTENGVLKPKSQILAERVPTSCNASFNLNEILARNILQAEYFKSLFELQTHQQVIDGTFCIYNFVYGGRCFEN